MVSARTATTTTTTTKDQPTLFGTGRGARTRVKASERGIHGAGIDEERDSARLITQQDAVRNVLLAATVNPRLWLTVEEIQDKVERVYRIRCPQASASAQVRNLRKPTGGEHVIAWRYREGTRLAEYRMG